MKGFPFFLLMIFPVLSNAQDQGRDIINLNGIWEFDQTINAFPPQKFNRKIQVPGLIHLASPKIEDYERFFKHEETVKQKNLHNLYDIDYEPRYSWYRKTFFVPAGLNGKNAVITLKKSQYVTQVYINGRDMGTSMACYTPIEFPVNQTLKYGQENEILVRVGDRIWLPSQAAGATDKEKEHYLPGIWDDVYLSFTGKLRINRVLLLPYVKEKKVSVKLQVRSFFPPQLVSTDDPMEDTSTVNVTITDRVTGEKIGSTKVITIAHRDNLTEFNIDVDVNGFSLWTPEKPNLCEAEIELLYRGVTSDKLSKKFGMRDFATLDKFFYLNEEKTILRGANISLQRFFEDPDCSNLVWDRNWVKKLLIDIPKGLNWNTMRTSVGILPDFWYDLADEYGLMFQNEWLYWQNHGWPEQINKEYTDWVWTDGSHPCIVIWDAINENQNEYIGKILIPELKKLDPTRIWDAGYMSEDNMKLNEMDEPHPYEGPECSLPWLGKHIYPLGDLNYRNGVNTESQTSDVPQLVNEYGWNWLLRNGNPSKLTVEFYKYYLGENATTNQRRGFQAYWLQLETEWLRSQSYHAGVLAFCYLTNNYGYTGDWFINNIKDLEPSTTLSWFKHAFAPQAVFINITDGRFMKQQKQYAPGSNISFTLYCINDKKSPVFGSIDLKLYDENGHTKKLSHLHVSIPATGNNTIPVNIELPKKTGGYLLVADFINNEGEKTISRRYIKIGEADTYSFFEIEP